MAPVIRALPPSATGQPAEWASATGAPAAPDRGQQQLRQLLAVAGHRAQQPPVGGGGAAEPRRGLRDRPGDHRGPAAVQRLGEHHLRAGEGDPAGGQAETLEEG